MIMRIFDTHCHIADDAFSQDVDAVIDRFLAAGVCRANVIADPCEEEPNQEKVFSLVGRHDFLVGSIGVHPHNASRFCEDTIPELKRYLARPDCVCLGEIGLDYHYDLSPRDVQREVFARQLDLAYETDMPVQLHIREAHEDALSILAASLRGGRMPRGILHCCTCDYETARGYLDAGLFVSMSGAVTFKNAAPLREVCENMPADRLLIETDCPYMAPVPLRGKRCEPAFITHTLACVAAVRGASPESVAELTYQNALCAFGMTEG